MRKMHKKQWKLRKKYLEWKDNMNVKTYLEQHVLLFDGAMGTYFSSVYEEPHYKCENANITSPHTIKEIHRRYLKAGAKAIKTNTFSVYEGREQEFSYQQLIRSGYELAREVAKDYDAFVFCDIGPIQVSSTMNPFHVYRKVIDEFLSMGGQNFLFETFLEDACLNQLAEYIKEQEPEAYIIVSYAVNPDGFTKTGQYGQQLLKHAGAKIDAVGFNCVCGPHHMKQHVKASGAIEKPLLVMPNASYPTIIGSRVSYENNPQYFAKQMMSNVEVGAKIIGGCCGTTPMFIELIKQELDQQHIQHKSVSAIPVNTPDEGIHKSEFYELLRTEHKKPIAVELDSPVNAKVRDFMHGAGILKEAGVDLITIADCPVARARMDSSLLACKLKRELGINVMPHMTCRDRNINASKALLLGLNIEEINNVLIVTGDPIPSEQRSEVKSVYEFNSRMLIHHISQLNETLFDSPFYLYGALNINARNFQVQLRLAKEKVKRGAMAFFTQPVLSEEGFENLKIAKEELGVSIVGGILPIVSYRNACFINNEIPGINVCEEIVALYEDKTKEECSELAIQISSEIGKRMEPYIDGYYLITPFKRVDIIKAIIENLSE